MRTWIRRLGMLTVVAGLSGTPAFAQGDVLTQHGDEARSGVYLNETQLTVDSVKTKLKKLYFRFVDGNVYAQPLYVSQLNFGGTKHNVIYVATEQNNVYAFEDDATDPNPNKAPIWKKNLGTFIPSTVLSNDLGKGDGGCVDMTTEVGITSTPVIDRAAGVIYVSAKTKDAGAYAHTLYALDLLSGNIQRQVVVAGDVNGTGTGSNGATGKITFNPGLHLNRPGLLLDRTRDLLYVAFGGHCDAGLFHGWLFAYKASTLARIDAFNTTPNIKDDQFDGEGGIWMSGQGPSLDDDGNVYLSTGNGSFDGVTDFGNSVVKIAVEGGKIVVKDFFVPTNQENLKIKDVDLGSGGVLLLKQEKLLITGGKEGVLYLLDARPGKMGTPIDAFQATSPPMPLFNFAPGQPPKPAPGELGTQRIRFWNIHGAPIAWDSPIGRLVYVCGEEDPIKAFRMVTNGPKKNRKFEKPVPIATSDERSPIPNFPGGRPNPADAASDTPWMPGAFLALSANQGAPDPSKTGIVWALMPLNDNANQKVARGALRAFDASNFATRPDGSKRLVQIWSSDQNPAINGLGMYAKFCAPTVANGRVIVPTFNEEIINGATNVHSVKPGGARSALVVYGLP